MVQINPKEERILEGWYPAEIGQVEEMETQFGERLMVPFEVEAEDGAIVEIIAFISFSDHPKSNVVKWGRALFGNRPFDTDEFTGVLCEVFVEEGEDKQGDPKNFVRKVRPRKSGSKANTKSKVTAGAEDPEADFEDIPL
jgi:hypothetical protein